MKKLLLFLFMLGGLSALAQSVDSIQKPGKFIATVSKEVGSQYLLYLPDGYSPDSRELWPMLVFLHGSGERGDNLEMLKVHGPPKLIEQGKKFPFIVLSPQCKVKEDFDTETLFALINKIAQDYNVDKSKICVTGLSMGGWATWNLAMAYPDYFAAVAPVCGYVNRNFPERAAEIKDLPVWVFHGANDDVVPVHREANMVSALRALGSNVQFTIYPTANHDAWTETYNNDALYKWFLQQSSKGMQSLQGSVPAKGLSEMKYEAGNTAKMEWFENARLGIFIHWGIYAVNGVSESWSFFNKRITHKDYMKQIKGFTAAKYDPAYWAGLIKESGARYAVITSKHHDGVALWNTQQNDLSIPAGSPAQRDVLTPFIKELRKEGIKAGLYFSLIDWTHPDYPGFLKDEQKYKLSDRPEKWEKFLKFNNGQISELLRLINPDLWWFDGDWEHSAEEWKAADIRQTILKYNPAAIINGRLAGFGDYETPEQNIPIYPTPGKPWELCLTTNTSWGYQPDDTEYKTPDELITILAEITGKGGNLLLDIGPREDGTIPDEQVNILKETGKWTGKHNEAVFGTVAGIPEGHVHCPVSMSQDSTILYLFTGDSKDVLIKGLSNSIRKVSVLGMATEIPFKVVGKISWSEVPGLVFMEIPDIAQDKYLTVLKVELEGKVKLYRGKGGFYE